MSFSTETKQHEQNIQDYLAIVYQDLPPITAPQSILAHTSGEILYPSLNRLFQAISLTPEDILIDLGSGRGNLVLQTFLTQKLKKVVGIEIRSDLHQQALQAWQRVQRDLASCLSTLPEIEFLLGDFLAVSLNEASIALINATCFGPDLMLQLSHKLDNTMGIHTVCSLRPLPWIQRLKCQKIISLQCSWDTALCYIYRS